MDINATLAPGLNRTKRLSIVAKAGGLQIPRCQGLAVAYYGCALGALTLEPSSFCNDRDYIKNTAINTLFSVIVTLVVTLYTFIPKVLSAMSPIDKSQVEQMLRKHESFVSNGNIEGMLSLYHPNFSMDIIYASGRVESFDKSQIAKHLETMRLIVSTLKKGGRNENRVRR